MKIQHILWNNEWILKFSCQKIIFLNIPKNRGFPFTKTFFVKKVENYKFFAINVISVKDAKVLH
jgi:hypothetical protein